MDRLPGSGNRVRWIATRALPAILVVSSCHPRGTIVATPRSAPPPPPAAAGRARAVRVHYLCDGGRSIDATYDDGGPGTGAARAPAPGTPPAPTGSVLLLLSDGRVITLRQTISGSGVRYASRDDSLVFWSKGNGAFILEHDEMSGYTGCIRVADDPGGLPNVFESGTLGFSIRYPAGFSVDPDYRYEERGPGGAIGGVKFTIAPAPAGGTNLAPDSYLSIEEIPGGGGCTADRFLDGAPAATPFTEGGVTYSVTAATGAGAGNRHEEHVFAIPGTNPCVAVRYVIHYAVLENYPPGAVRAFDHDALIRTFDAMRGTLVIQP